MYGIWIWMVVCISPDADSCDVDVNNVECALGLKGTPKMENNNFQFISWFKSLLEFVIIKSFVHIRISTGSSSVNIKRRWGTCGKGPAWNLQFAKWFIFISRPIRSVPPSFASVCCIIRSIQDSFHSQYKNKKYIILIIFIIILYKYKCRHEI